MKHHKGSFLAKTALVVGLATGATPAMETDLNCESIEQHRQNTTKKHSISKYSMNEFLSYLNSYENSLPSLLAEVDKYGDKVDPMVFRDLTSKLSQLHRYEEAKVYALEFLKTGTPTNVKDFNSIIGNFLYEAKKYDEAGHHYLVALKTEENDYESSEDEVEEYSSDSDTLDEPLVLHGRDTNEALIESYINVCKAFYKAGKLEELTPYLTKAIAFSTKKRNYSADYDLYDFLVKLKRYEEAFNTIKREVDRSKHEIPTGYAAELFFCLTKLERHEEAEKYKVLAIKNIDSLQDYMSIADAFHKLGEYEQAIFHLKLGLENASKYPEEEGWQSCLHSFIAKVYTKMGNHEEADRFVKLAIEKSIDEWDNKMRFDEIVKFLTKAGQQEQVEKVRQFTIDLLTQGS